MLHKVRVTVLERMLNADLQRKYCADPESGKCPCCHEGDEFIFERYGDRDDFWHCGAGTLVRTDVKSGQSERMAGASAGDARRKQRSSVLLRGLGCGKPLHLHCSPGREHHAWLDEG